MRTLWTLGTLCGHEIRARLRDGTAVVLAFVAPVLMATLFSLALGGDDERLDVTVGIVEPGSAGGGPLAARLAESIAGSADLRGSVRLRPIQSAEEAARALRAKQIDAALVFPAGFGTPAAHDRPVEIDVLRSTDSELGGIVARVIADRFAAAATRRQILRDAAIANGIPPDRVESYVDGELAGTPPIGVAADQLGGGKETAIQYGPGMAMLFAFFVVGTSTRSLVTERQLGTLRRMVSMSVPAWTIVAGKGLSGCALALASMCTTWAASVVLFDVSWGPPGDVLAVLTALAVAAAAITTLVASRARTEAQAGAFTTIASFVMAICGGNFVASYQLPEVVQRVALVTPNAWAMRAFATLTTPDGGPRDISGPLSAMAAVALIAGAAAFLRLRRGVFT